jgi:hypothetical protein
LNLQISFGGKFNQDDIKKCKYTRNEIEAVMKFPKKNRIGTGRFTD